MTTVSKSFTAATASETLYIRKFSRLYYVISGSYVGKLILQKLAGGTGWLTVKSFGSGATDNTFIETGSEPVTYRFAMDTYSSGTAVTTLSDGGVIETTDAVQAAAERGISYPSDLATITIDVEQTRTAVIAALSQETTIANPTGTSQDRWLLMIDITTASSQGILYGDQFRGTDDLDLPTDTTGSGKTDSLLFVRHASANKWTLLASNLGA